MTCKYEELPQQCQSCLNLRCGYVRMDGHNEYHCRKVICFDKYKESDCKKFEMDMEAYQTGQLN